MVKEVPWGRLLIAGGTDFATLGRKDKLGKSFINADRPDLPAFHILRPVANIKFKRVITTHSGCHAVAISISNQAYLLGRNEHHQLSYPLPSQFTVPHPGTDGLPSPTPAAGFPIPIKSLPDANVPKLLKDQGIVEAACGRGHTILITSNGEAWSAGWNVLGQCGQNGGEHISTFTRVKGALLHEKVIAASAGNTFSLFLTATGKVYAVGSGEKGQLGNGKTGEHIAASKVFFSEQREPLLVRGAIEGKKIVQITSGQQHSVVLDDQGFCYAWGFGGLGRLGMGAQADALVPTIIPNFAGPNILTRATKIAAGGTNTMFIDAQGMVSLCGKWKTSGDGSSGQPWMTPKLVQDIMGYKWQNISAGGVTLFTATHDAKEGDFLVAWGQGAHNGELALGSGSVKSATKPTRVDAMDGITIIDLAAGQNTTFVIARPPPIENAAAKATEEEKDTVTDDATTDGNKAKDDETPSTTTTTTSLPVVGIDLSGFGFSFGPPPPQLAQVVTLPTVKGISRTNKDQWESLERWPPVLDAVDHCQVCGKDDGELIECEMCEQAFHGICLDPPVPEIPEGEWFCQKCNSKDDIVPPEKEDVKAAPASNNKKRKTAPEKPAPKKRKN